jgi:hypothetical protein
MHSWIATNLNAQEALCDIEVVQQYASWLCNYAKKSNGIEYLKAGTILDILSSNKKMYNTLFPSNTIFSGKQDQVWCTLLRAKSFQETLRRDMKRGVASSNKSKPVGRVLMRYVNETLIISINTYQSIRKAVYAGYTFNSAGR